MRRVRVAALFVDVRAVDVDEQDVNGADRRDTCDGEDVAVLTVDLSFEHQHPALWPPSSCATWTALLLRRPPRTDGPLPRPWQAAISVRSTT